MKDLHSTQFILNDDSTQIIDIYGTVSDLCRRNASTDELGFAKVSTYIGAPSQRERQRPGPGGDCSAPALNRDTELAN